MKTNLFKLFALMMMFIIGGGSVGISAAQSTIQLPMESQTCINLTNAVNVEKTVVLDKAKLEKDDVYSIGNTSKGTCMTVSLHNSQSANYILSFRSGSKNEATVKITVKDNKGYNCEQTYSIPKQNSWDRNNQHYMTLKNLPEGDLTLTLEALTPSSGFAGNYGFFSFFCEKKYDDIEKINLASGKYVTARYQDPNVGYCSNGATAEYVAFNGLDGLATMNIGLDKWGSVDGTMTVTITDVMTDKQELTKDLAITTQYKKYNIVPFELGSITKGLKKITLKINTTDSYLCNYKDLGITVAPQATVGETGFATIGFPCAVTLPEDVKAYAITSVSDNTVTLTEVNSNAVAANTGLIICAKPGTYTFAQATEGDEVADNKLVANTDAEKVAEAEKEFYVLGITNATKKTVGMMPIAANGTIGQYKAYLPATAVASLAKGLKIVFGNDQATAISEVEANGAEATNNTAYNVLGQRINGNAKGIVIINGKKYIK